MTTRMADCSVSFFVVGKAIGVNRYEVVVGCLEPNEIYLCLDDWKQKSFVTLAVSGKFASLERQRYRFQVDGEYEFLQEHNDHLERMPGEADFSSVLVDVSQSKDACGCVNIYTAGDHTSRLVAQLPLPLTAEIQASPRVEAPWPQEKNRRHILNNFFVSVVKNMKPDVSLFEELGLSGDEVERIREDTSSTDTEYSMFMMLDKCCEMERDNATFLRALLVTLGKVQQNNVKLLLVEDIRHWLAVSTPDEEDEIFAKELSSIVNDFKGQGSTIVPGDYRNTTYTETRNFKEKSLRNMDIRFDGEKQVGAEKTHLRLTYSEPVDNPHGFVAKVDETFMGDLIEWCISSPSIHFAIVFHLEEEPSRYSELILRYGTVGHKQEEALVHTVFIPEGQRWQATTQITVGPRGWFVLCTRPKETLTEVPVDGCTVVYDLDERVQINIPKNAFECSGSMCLKAVEMEYEGNDLESIISLSTFYNINHTSGHQPREHLKVTLPLPERYTGEGELLVLSRPVSEESEEQRGEESEEDNEEDEEETYWTILDTVISVNGNVATFFTNHFSEFVLGEYKRKAWRSRVKKQTRLHRRRGLKDQVKFAAWGKFLNSSVYDVVVECCLSRKFKKRSKTWLKKGYFCLRDSGEFQAQNKSVYRIGVCGNALSLYDISKLKLIYKRGATSFQSLHVEIMNEKYFPLAAISIMDKSENVKTYLPFELDESMTVVQKADIHEGAAKEYGHGNIEDYIRDTLMDPLSNEVFGLWWKVWLYAGVPLAKLMRLVTNRQFNSLGRSKQEWIIGHSGKSDYGLTDLIKALRRAECHSAAQQVVTRLKNCLNSEAFKKNWSNTAFGKWLKTQTLKLENTENEPSKPMSDAFLVDILQYFAVDIKSLGIECGLTTQEHCELSEPLPFGQQFQLFTVLFKVRQKAQHRHEGLRVLLKALKQLEQNDTKERIIFHTKKWLDTTENDRQCDADSFLAVIEEFSGS